MRPIHNITSRTMSITPVIFLVLFICIHGYASPGDESAMAMNDVKTIEVTIPIGSFSVQHSERGDELTIEGFGRLFVPGKPDLPSRIFSVAIPPGSEVVGVTFEPGRETFVPATYRVPPVDLPRVIGKEDPQVYRRDRKIYEENYLSSYTSDEIYPRTAGEYLGRAGFRRYDLVDVRITPFRYRPESGRLAWFSEVTVRVEYRLPGRTTERDIVDDYLPRKEAIARDIIVNYAQAQAWYDTQEKQTQQGINDFVIITLESLVPAVTPLVDWEMTKGRTVEVVTTNWIDSNYAGYDLAEKIRNLLRDMYPSVEWGIEDVLLVGNYDDVPMRNCWQDVGYGRPDTDFYFAELSLPDNQSWDADGDRRYGETYDDPIDFYAEINVGRIPWSDYDVVENICRKSVAYEQNNDPAFKRNILLLGAYFWEDTDNAVLMEYKVDPVLHPWMADWTMTRMYEQNSDYWSDYECDYPLLHGNVMNVWPEGRYSFVNWAGHGSPTSCHIYGLYAPAFIMSSDSYSLNDDYPAIIFADACSNSDTDYDNIGQMMMRQGAVGFLGSTEVAYGMPAWNHPYDGSSQSLENKVTTSHT